jgi:predicted AlkP superfamily phosphohydrolase/phosphomutase/tetratricopeptide (TPR) repeat protein
VKVLFIGWDAAEWKVIHPLLDSGRMPNLRRLIEHGAMGRAATLSPPLSPMLWTSIATGKRPFRHGIHGFAEPTPDGRGVQPITNLSRTCKAVWNILNQNGLRSTVVGWWPSHPAEPLNGVMVSDHYHKASGNLDAPWPLLKDAVHPVSLRDKLAELRFHPQELVEPMLSPFLPHLEKIDQENDRRFSQLCVTLAECVSIHSAATWLMDNEPWDFFAVYYDAIDHFSHGFMRYHPPRQPQVSAEDFERYSSVISAAYVLHDRMLGTLLAKSGWRPDGGETRVILMSDHGFHPDHLRPGRIPDFPAGPAAEHSPYGIFVTAGPGIRKDALLTGVSVLDATPTVLAMYGLPVGEDMDGRVIESAFEQPPNAGSIPCWEEVPGDDGRHPPHMRLDPVASAEAMEQLAALGYIERPGEDMEEYIESTVRELRFNLMESYQNANRHREALEIARDLCRRDPDDQRFAVRRFLSCQALGLTAEMREIADDMAGRRREIFLAAAEQMRRLRHLAVQRYAGKAAAAGKTLNEEEQAREVAYEMNPRLTPPAPREFLLDPAERRALRRAIGARRYQPAMSEYLQAQTLTAEKRWFEALEVTQRIASLPSLRQGLLLHSADLLRRLGRSEEAEGAYRRTLEADPDNVHAHLGLARLALKRREFERAAAEAQECIARLYFFPLAHFLRGVARLNLRDTAGAREAFETALEQNPHFPQAHLWLARLLKFRLRDKAAAEEHLALYREMRRDAGPARKMQEAEAAIRAEPAKPDSVLAPLGDDVLVVSGLPRSGTSMLMQMLEAGGVRVLTDRVRAADEDNPKGYFEFEAVKKLMRDPGWLPAARGMAVKIVAPLVCSLPPGSSYRVLLLERDCDEVLDSQAKMIARRGGSEDNFPERRARLREEFTRIIERTKKMLGSRGDVELMGMQYREIVRDPARAAARINGFLGGTLDTERMAAAVDRTLHRNRRQN